MPGSMDGMRLAAVIRDRWPPIALLVTSGQVQPGAEDLPRGAQFISKPYLPVQLSEQLAALAPR
jgi:two-component system, response regulator PdtaR